MAMSTCTRCQIKLTSSEAQGKKCPGCGARLRRPVSASVGNNQDRAKPGFGLLFGMGLLFGAIGVIAQLVLTNGKAHSFLPGTIAGVFVGSVVAQAIANQRQSSDPTRKS